MLDQLGISYGECHETLATDSDKKAHTILGKIDLRWHVSGKAKSFPETFFVVESMNPSVILGSRAISVLNQREEHEIHVLGLEKQSAGTNPQSCANSDIVRSLRTGDL